MTTHKKDDRVCRPADIFGTDSPLLTGSVAQVYSDTSCIPGILGDPVHYPELYEVLWDNGQCQKGFLPRGLSALGAG